VKTSSEPLAVDVEEDTQKDEMNVGISSSATIDKDDTAASGNRPSKRAKKDDNGADPLVQAFDRGTQTIASAIRDAASKEALPPGLSEAVDSLPGFELEHKAKYYSYLLNHPNVAHGFVDAPLLYKLSMVTEFINADM
jgi:hypothetical protein